MKIKYVVGFDEAPPWLTTVEIEREGDSVKFTAVKRNDNVLSEFSIPFVKLERMLAQLKED